MGSRGIIFIPCELLFLVTIIISQGPTYSWEPFDLNYPMGPPYFSGLPLSRGTQPFQLSHRESKGDPPITLDFPIPRNPLYSNGSHITESGPVPLRI